MVKPLLCLLWAGALFAQPYATGPQVLTIFSDLDDTDQPYGLYLPPGFDASRKYPLLICLHGAWSNHRLNLRRVFGKGNRPGETDLEATRYFPPFPNVDYIVATPLGRGTMGYQGIPEKDVYDVLDDVRKRFPIDEDRVYLTGLSMGGGGALWLGLTRPDIWAAIAAVCPAVPAGTEDLAPNALNVPVHLFHGEADPTVPAADSRRWHKRLLEQNSTVAYIEYPGVSHNAWDRAYKDASIFEWFDKHRRNKHPREVRFVTRSYKHSSAYWVRIDGLTPGERATVEARFTGRNQVEVKTAGVDGFTLTPEGHPMFDSGRTLEVTVDGKPQRVKPARTVSFLKPAAKNGEAWKPGLYKPAPEAKRPGLEGPIAEVFTSRHIFVYGTADAPSPEELERRKNEANAAAEWSGGRHKLLLGIRVMADRDVKEPELKASNLVLFGSGLTNSLIAKLAGSLPMELNPGAADYGLLCVIRNGERYALISSGLPWWKELGAHIRPGRGFMPPHYRVLMSLPDFILFRGSLEQVVAEGRFDRNWKLPPEHAEVIKATGAVRVR